MTKTRYKTENQGRKTPLSTVMCFEFYVSVFLHGYLKPVIHFTKQNILRGKKKSEKGSNGYNSLINLKVYLLL